MSFFLTLLSEDRFLEVQKFLVGRYDPKKKFDRNLLKLASDHSVCHPDSNSVNDTEIWVHMKKIEKFKFYVWLFQMVGGDDMENTLNEWGSAKWKDSIGPAYRSL